MTKLEELVRHHEEMAEVTAAAALGAGMAKGRGLGAQAEKHREWAAFLRSLQPPAQTWIPKLRSLRGGGQC